MHDLFQGIAGERLSLAEYWPDFEKNFWQTTAPGFWKLERQQIFQEPDNASWKAFADGDWAGALRVLDEQRESFADYYRRIAARGFRTRRVRVVEKPMTPYLQWELHVLRLRHKYGGLTRVVGPERVAPYETAEPLPEIYTLGTAVMYEAIYDADGVLAAANRWTDRDLIVHCQTLIENLYRTGEPLDAFFAREVATVAPPGGH